MKQFILLSLIALVSSGSQDAIVYYGRGLAKSKKGELEGAIADLDQAIELNPKLLEPGPDPRQAIYEGQCPYRGLRAFDVDDSLFFLGREALVQWLLNEVRPAPDSRPINRFLAIVGASGSGKSSVARAGLVAALKHHAIPGSARWPVAICRPGADPLESLAVALSSAANVGQGAATLADLIAEFQKNDKTLHLIARQSLPENAPERRLLILVDQFEEIFTLFHKDELREALIDNLFYATKIAQGQTLVF